MLPLPHERHVVAGNDPLGAYRPVQTEAVQAKRREQQAWLDSLYVGELAPIHPCEDYGQPTTYTRYCTACQGRRYLWHLWEDEELHAWEIANGCA